MNSLLKFKIFSILIAITLSLFQISITNAQIPGSLDGVDIKSEPKNPYPKQNVEIRVESFNTDLNSASIVWLINGKNFKRGTGITSINITAPPLGQTTKVVVAILTVEGKEVEKIITVSSGDVDLVWESDGYKPPLYKGKSLFAYQNQLKVTAIPHIAKNKNGDEIPPNTLVYKWKENDKVVQDQSGFGKQSLLIKSDLPKSSFIEVEVTTKDGSSKAQSSINLVPSDPSITFYEEDPLYGIMYNKALKDRVVLSNKEINLLASPYSFSLGNFKNSPLKYIWSINSIEQPDLSNNQSITLRTKDETEGNSLITLDIKNQNDILQGSNNFINIYFTKKKAENNTTF